MIFKTFAGARKYDLTINLILFRPFMKVEYMNNYKAVFNFK